jgi:hypothetical protein
MKKKEGLNHFSVWKNTTDDGGNGEYPLKSDGYENQGRRHAIYGGSRPDRRNTERFMNSV